MNIWLALSIIKVLTILLWASDLLSKGTILAVGQEEDQVLLAVLQIMRLEARYIREQILIAQITLGAQEEKKISKNMSKKNNEWRF